MLGSPQRLWLDQGLSDRRHKWRRGILGDQPPGYDLEQAAFHALDAWQIEVYHRGLKQFTGVERGQYRLEVSQRNHIGLAIRAYIRLEVHRLQTGVPGSKPRLALFVLPCVCIWLIRPLLSVQLRKSYTKCFIIPSPTSIATDARSARAVSYTVSALRSRSRI